MTFKEEEETKREKCLFYILFPNIYNIVAWGIVRFVSCWKDIWDLKGSVCIVELWQKAEIEQSLKKGAP
jgi:hypothetical protein